MYYTITFDGKVVVEQSELGVQVDNTINELAMAIPADTCALWCENFQLIDTERKSVENSWTQVYGERAVVEDNYNELVLIFNKGTAHGIVEDEYNKFRDYKMNIEVRAYNEGVAFRYSFPEASNGLFLHVTGEQTSFVLPEGTKGYYEVWAQGPYELRELEGWEEECERPLTLKLENGLTVALGEAAMIDYVRGKFELDKQQKNTLKLKMHSSVDIPTPYSTPWRVVMAANNAIDLINNNDIILNLNEPNKIEDTSWIKPGKVFRTGLTMDVAKEGVDFAVRQGLQYIHFDAGWYGLERSSTSDATKEFEERDLKMAEICEYAESKGIGVFVYVNQRALTKQLDDILPLYKEWGIKGIKFGFVHVGNQQWSTWLHNAIIKCAKYGIMVDVHDEYRPTGFSRTYPNLMSQEGIRGNEEMPDATHNVTLPYTRYLAGAGDYTLCYFSPRILTTKAHQLAMAAVYYSPLQFMFWYDQTTACQGEKELDFWRDIPTVWDDSRAIDGQIGEYITMARRSGDDWFVGTMTNNDAREVSIDTALFLEDGAEYELIIYNDNPELGTRTNVEITTQKAKKGDKLDLSLQASGGAALHFKKIK